MNELFPIVGGLIAGLVTLSQPRRVRFLWLIVLCSVVGVTATLSSGEYQIGWYFALIDEALAAGAALSAPTFVRAMRRRLARNEALVAVVTVDSGGIENR